MVLYCGGGERHRAANVGDLQPRAAEVFRRWTLRQHTDRALGHHLRDELVRVEKRPRDGGEEHPLTRAPRVVADIGYKDRFITREFRISYRSELLDRYRFIHHHDSNLDDCRGGTAWPPPPLISIQGRPRSAAPTLVRIAPKGLWFHDDRGDVLVADQLIKRRDVGSHYLRELLQLRVDLRDQIVVNRIRLRGGRRVHATHHTAERRELV